MFCSKMIFKHYILLNVVCPVSSIFPSLPMLVTHIFNPYNPSTVVKVHLYTAQMFTIEQSEIVCALHFCNWYCTNGRHQHLEGKGVLWM
jgi:hypothetical protein